MTDTIFNADPASEPTAQPTEPVTQTQEPDPAPTPQPQADPYNDLLKGITTSDGRQKYGTVSDALNSIPAAQAHIATLERELAEARAQADQTSAVDKVLEKLDAQTADRPNGLTESTVLELVQQALSNDKSATIAEQNTAAVTTAMTEMFGDDAEKEFYAKADELGISRDFFNSMAAKSPKAVLSYFTKPGAPIKTSSSQTTESFQDRTPTLKTNVMGGASKADIDAVWKSCAPV